MKVIIAKFGFNILKDHSNSSMASSWMGNAADKDIPLIKYQLRKTRSCATTLLLRTVTCL